MLCCLFSTKIIKGEKNIGLLVSAMVTIIVLVWMYCFAVTLAYYLLHAE